MGLTDSMQIRERFSRSSPVGVGALLVLVCLSVIGVAGGYWKIFIISWVGFMAMAGGAIPGARAETISADRLVWGYGLASGAMIMSAAIFLVPEAIGYSPTIGGVGIAAGILVGYGAHTIGHRLSHIESFDSTSIQLSAHSLADGAIIGLVYATLPDLGLLLGLGIVSHKGPAGYAAARQLSQTGKPVSLLLLPAAGVGLAAFPIALVDLGGSSSINAVIFGFATGTFLHVAMDFLPQCEIGNEIGDAVGQNESDDVHAELDRLRVHAVVSTILGAGAVAIAWALLA
ncbi:ZIP family metal transporter [Halocatena marina]